MSNFFIDLTTSLALLSHFIVYFLLDRRAGYRHLGVYKSTTTSTGMFKWKQRSREIPLLKSIFVLDLIVFDRRLNPCQSLWVAPHSFPITGLSFGITKWWIFVGKTNYPNRKCIESPTVSLYHFQKANNNHDYCSGWKRSTIKQWAISHHVTVIHW